MTDPDPVRQVMIDRHWLEPGSDVSTADAVKNLVELADLYAGQLNDTRDLLGDAHARVATLEAAIQDLRAGIRRGPYTASYAKVFMGKELDALFALAPETNSERTPTA